MVGHVEAHFYHVVVAFENSTKALPYKDTIVGQNFRQNFRKIWKTETGKASLIRNWNFIVISPYQQ